MFIADIHPSVADLEAFTLGTLDDAALAAVESHVADCPICQERAADTSGDDLVEVLRRVQSQATSQIDTVAPTQTPGPVPAAGEDGASLDAIPHDLVGHERYRVVRLLGEGGMGSVYEAEHRVMQRAVAVKIIKSAYTSSPAAVERFRREVRAAARLAHPNIVTTYDAEDAGKTLFLVMEYVEGVSLARLVKEQGPLPVAEACDYIRQAALGLEHAHERGMVHRDVKPDNLILAASPVAQAPGVVKVLDFGLAALAVERGGDLTEANVVMGTPDYMAPEQAESPHGADIRADVYSLGCTLYYLLTAKVPYPASNSVQRILAHREQPLPALSKARPEVPPQLARIMARLLAKKPEDRYQTPAEVAAALAPFTPAASPAQKRRSLLTAIAAALFAVTVVAAGVIYRIQTDTGELIITTESDDVEVIIKEGGKTVRIVDTKSDKEIALSLYSGVYQLELQGAPEGLKLSLETATLTRGKTVLAKIQRRAKPATFAEQPAAKNAIRLIHRIDWRTDGVVIAASVAPRGRYFLGALSHESAFPRGVRVWDGETGRSLWDHNDSHFAQFSPDGEQVYALDTRSWVVHAYRTATGELIRDVCHLGQKTFSFYLSADGKYLLAQGDSAQSVWGVADGKMLREWPPRLACEFALDSESISVALGGDAGSRVYRLPTLQEVKLPDPLAAFDPVIWQPAGQYAIAPVSGTPPESWWLVKADGAKVHRWLPKSYSKMLSGCHWVNDRESLVSLDDGTLRLFDVLTHQERACFHLPAGEKVLRTEPSLDRGFVGATTNKGGILVFRVPDLPE